MSTRLCLALLLLSLLVYPVAALAQWQMDGTALCTAANSQSGPTIVSDGAGGAIVTWYDNRSGISHIYAQRVNASGVAQWTADGVALCTAANGQLAPTIVSDGAGGAIVTWQDSRNGIDYDIYAQRVNASGVAQWTADGVALSTAANNQYSPAIASDGAGGAIVTWQDSRSGNYDIYAQRVDASGVTQWTADGVALCTAGNYRYYPKIVSDGAGGAIVTWQDFRALDWDVYAQRVDASGIAQWATDGVLLCTAAGYQEHPTITSDAAGGAIVTWYDDRNGIDYDIYAQRVNASGVAQWTADGVALCTAGNQQYYPTIASDGSGGAIVTWEDLRNGTYYDIYAQRVNASGAAQWTLDGVALCTAPGPQSLPAIVSDGAGGAIVTWQDFRATDNDIYAQRVNASGAIQWTTDGMALSTAANNQYPPAIASDGAGGAIVTWPDYRSDPTNTNAHVYAQRVEGTYGYWGHPEPIVTSVADVPNDQGGHVAVNWKASGRDLPVPSAIKYYSIWRAVDAAAAATAPAPGSTTPLDRIGPDTPPGTLMTMAGSSYYWELVGTQEAFRWAAYSFSASTRADSVSGNPSDEVFMVAAHDVSDEQIAFPSNVMTGHSVDNLAPAAPLYLTAQRNGSEVDLSWNGVHVSDLKDYAVYRSDASGVTPIQTDFLADDTDTVLVDSGAPLTSLYYIVTAYDVHQNQSKPSNEASVSATTNADHTPSLTALTVLQNRPNPFASQTELEIGLPSASEIHLEVYDVAGHRVREEDVAGVRGWQEIRFSGRDDRGEPLASGMYFYKVAAHGETVTRKMLITR